jgi:hypothetical protein
VRKLWLIKQSRPIEIQPGSFNFLAKRETECTSEMSGGQFSIFGAVEENLRGGVSVDQRDQSSV